MRVLVVGSTFDTDLSDTVEFASVLSVFDYEVVVWETGATLEPYHVSTPYQSLPTFETNEGARLTRDLERRSREFRDLLALGRTLVILDPEPQPYFVQVKTEYSGAGRNTLRTPIVERREVLSASPVPLATREGTGSRIELVADEPFSTFWRRVRSDLAYTAYFDDAPGTPFLVVAGTRRAVGTYVQVGAGSVLILPAPGYPDDADDATARRIDKEFVSALIELVRSLGNTLSPLPDWVSRYELPGEPEAIASLANAEKQVRDAAEARDARAAELGRIETLKSLLVETGKPLERLVRAALEGLGCVTEDGDPGRTEFVLRWGSKTAVVEVKGVTKSAKEQDAAQLEKWVAEQYEKDGRRPKGLLVVNAYREVPLDKRTAAAFPNQMHKYSVAREHCLMTTTQLLGALLDQSSAKRTLTQVFRTKGVLSLYEDWRVFLTHSAEPTSALDAAAEPSPTAADTATS